MTMLRPIRPVVPTPTATVRALAAGLLALALAACRDDVRPALAPAPSGMFLTAAVRCEVKPGDRQARCGSAVTGRGNSREQATARASQRLMARQQEPSAPGTMNAVVFGGQDEQVHLEIVDVRTTAAADTTRLTMSLRNLTSESMGTLDNANPDVNGVQVFVANGPIVTGAGSSGIVTVTDIVDSTTFPPYSGRRPYVQLPGLLFPGAASRFLIGFSTPTTVTGFTFDLLVSTEFAQSLPPGAPQELYVLAMSAGATHACAISYDPQAFTDRAWCWGQGPGLGLAVDTASVVALPIEGFRFTQLVSPGLVTCGLTPEGLIYCWGQQSGFFNVTSSDTPQPMFSGVRVRQFATSNAHICGIMADSTAACAGLNAFGELGDGSVLSGFEPVRVAGGLKWREVTVGTQSSCGIAADSTAYCWGRNALGSLGDSTLTQRTVPTPVYGGRKWRTLKAGSEHVCGITASGAVYCWGSNTVGQVGNALDTFGTVVAPDSVAIPPGVATALASGDYYSCATQGTNTWCWGANPSGNLGSFNFGVTDTPAQVPVSDPFTQLTASSIGSRLHTCGLAAGVVRCWGNNDYGQLGNEDPGGNLPNPVTFNAGPVASVMAGFGNTCVIEAGAAGRTLCVGDNDLGGLGRGTSRYGRNLPTSVAQAYSIAVGGGHTCVQVNTVQCWGLGDAGQLGNAYGSSQQPVPISGSLSYYGIAAGYRHTCAIESGLVRCWGDNSFFQLGDGGRVTSTPSPVTVEDAGGNALSGMGSLALGTWHSCALDPSGIAWCWGSNFNGELGIGSTGSTIGHATPVAGNLRFQSLSAGLAFTCGVTFAKDLYCWGANNGSHLGYIGPDVNQPRLITSRLKWSHVAAGTSHACALTDAGFAYCWGENNFNELGLDVQFQGQTIPTPTRVMKDIQFKTIGVGEHWTCALQFGTEGTPWCWGPPTYFGYGATTLVYGPQRVALPVKKRPNQFGGG